MGLVGSCVPWDLHSHGTHERTSPMQHCIACSGGAHALNESLLQACLAGSWPHGQLLSLQHAPACPSSQPAPLLLAQLLSGEHVFLLLLHSGALLQPLLRSRCCMYHLCGRLGCCCRSRTAAPDVASKVSGPRLITEAIVCKDTRGLLLCADHGGCHLAAAAA
jgi:hypothetical protein